jgi:hypothetical protein
MKARSEVFESAPARLNITGTNNTLTAGGSLLGIFVASASATPTIKVADTAGTIVNTFTPAPATWYKIPARWGATLTITIGGTVDCTLFYIPN